MNIKQIRSTLSTVVVAIMLSIYNAIAEFIEAPFGFVLVFGIVGLFLFKSILNQLCEVLDIKHRSFNNNLIYINDIIKRKVYAL